MCLRTLGARPIAPLAIRGCSRAGNSMRKTGLYFYRARYYDTGKGRFLQRDPLGYVDGMNLYEYARNNPQNNLDPTGTKPITWDDFDVVDDAKLPTEDALHPAITFDSAYNTDCKETASIPCPNGTKWCCTTTTTDVKVGRARGEVKKNAKGNPGLLAHEQGHVDIDNKFEQSVVDAIKAAKGKGCDCDADKAQKMAEDDWNKQVEAARKPLDDAQEKYDNDTHHGKTQK